MAPVSDFRNKNEHKIKVIAFYVQNSVMPNIRSWEKAVLGTFTDSFDLRIYTLSLQTEYSINVAVFYFIEKPQSFPLVI